MNKKMTTIMALVLTLSLSLTACGSKASAASSAAASAEGSASAEASYSEDEAPYDESALPGSEAEEPDGTQIPFDGSWMDTTSQRASMTIFPDYEAENYQVVITWAQDSATASEWRMTATLDESGKVLSYEKGSMAVVTYDEDGNETAEEKWDDAAGTLTMGENNMVTWTDSQESTAADFAFEKVVTPAPEAEDFADSYFRAGAQYAPGTAGASLKQAEAACAMLQFAMEQDLWNCDIPAMRDNMLAAWESLSQEEQAAFDEGFMDIVSFMDEVFADPEGYQGLFEDAGVGDDMSRMLALPQAQMEWETLRDHTLTMGNDM